MEDDCGIDKIVSEFFLGTCQPRFRANCTAVTTLLESAHVKTIVGKLSPVGEYYFTPLITGSVAELYIDPVLSCIGDHDIMYHSSCDLAIPAGHSPPTQLPAEFGSRVAVYEFIDSEFPGYVYLMTCYMLIKRIEDNKCYAIEYERIYESYDRNNGDEMHGPARIRQSPGYVSLYFVEGVVKRVHFLDLVYCVRCLLWPSQAADWPTRQRNNGWPDSATIHRVVSNGCDVVRVAHRLCRDDEWESSHQHRLSFSRAEIVLLNSWMRVHQIMYHMLQIFVKAHIESNESEAKTLSNYHIKTLMLWACELKPASWWSDDFNVVEICVKLLHVLGVWLRDARCKHYFVRKCNLFDHLDKSGSHQLTAVKLTSVTVQSLSKWFVDNYIRKCSEYACTYFLGADSLSLQSPLFENTSTNAKLQDAVTEFVSRKHKHVTRSFAELFANFTPCQYYIAWILCLRIL